MSEYSGTSSNGPSCAYTSLGTYNNGYSMSVPAAGKVTSGAYIVPQWNAIQYDDLTAGDRAPSCSGYPTIEGAYGADAGSCQTTYSTLLCNGGGADAQARRMRK